MSAPTPAVKAKWRKANRKTWSADMSRDEYDKLKEIQGGLSNYQFLKKLIEETKSAPEGD